MLYGSGGVCAQEAEGGKPPTARGGMAEGRRKQRNPSCRGEGAWGVGRRGVGKVRRCIVRKGGGGGLLLLRKKR